MPKKKVKKQVKRQKKAVLTKEEFESALNQIRTEISAMREKELNAGIACNLLKLYFEEIARAGLKRQLTLTEVINAYKFTLERLETAGSVQEEREPISTLKEIKEAIEKPKETSETPYLLAKKGK